VLGSWSNWARWKDGKSAESIFNEVRPKYKIKRVNDIISDRVQFKEGYLDYDKSGYFDEKFEELSIDDICKKLDVDIRDIKEIIDKTKFKVEGAVIYTDDERLFISGEKDKVPVDIGLNINTFIHSHPIGTSFSIYDVLNANNLHINKIIAFNDDFFYCLDIDKISFDIDFEFASLYNKYYEILLNKVKSGDILKSQMNFVIMHKIWKEMFKNNEGVKYDYFKVKR